VTKTAILKASLFTPDGGQAKRKRFSFD
jgi:hypothetical protein